MSDYAYRDKLRTKIIYATEAKAEDKGEIFFCENPDCNAHLHLDALISEAVPPYFSAKEKNFPHVEGCYFKSMGNSFNKNEYDENLFNFYELVNEYLNGTVHRIPRRLYTLSQIYHMCKSKKNNDTYNNINIWKILCDNRSNYIYTRGLNGAHLIECKISRFNPDELTISLKYPFNDSLSNKYNLKVHDLFDRLLNLILNDDNTITKRPMIVLGNWRKINSDYVSNIATRTQIYIP